MLTKSDYSPTTGHEAASKKEIIYAWLTREFSVIEEKLDAEDKTNLDGILWKLAGELAEEKVFTFSGNENIR
jgi:hypothetical protein